MIVESLIKYIPPDLPPLAWVVIVLIISLAIWAIAKASSNNTNTFSNINQKGNNNKLQIAKKIDNREES